MTCEVKKKLEQLFNELEDSEKIVLYAIGALNNTPLKSKTKLQKLLFLISNVFQNYQDLLEFEPHLFGPYSETLENILEDLIKLELIERKGNRMQLTEKGLEMYKRIKPERGLKSIVEDFKSFLFDVPDNILLIFIYASYPEYIGESAKWDELKKERVDAAIYLLIKNKISFGKAVEISGLNLNEFEKELIRRKVKWRYDNNQGF
ncbi:MAG: UPF0175 family protein [Candidatus Heimdallarchaeota archaeon]|nr:UPF0175 family protein [Candidatus Heimdallarchaeota archaeon]